MIQISENAARQILKMLTKHGLEGGGLRVGLKAGGCSGFEYVFAWERDPRANDEVFSGPDGSRVFIDPKSYTLLKGTEPRLRHESDQPRLHLSQPERQEHVRMRVVV